MFITEVHKLQSAYPSPGEPVKLQNADSGALPEEFRFSRTAGGLRDPHFKLEPHVMLGKMM